MSPSTEKPRYVHLVKEFAEDAQELAEAHGQQIGDEVKADADRAINIVGLFSAAGSLMAIGFVFMIRALVQLLQDRYGLTETSAWGVTGAVAFVIGLAFLGIGRYLLMNLRWLPTQSLKSIKESLSWVSQGK